MNTKSLPLLVLGSITVAIHLLGLAVVQVGAERVLAQSVSYRDLDLSRPADAAQLYDRIGHAAAEVCEAYDGLKDARPALHHKCVERAIAATVARVNDANLTARHQEYKLAQSSASAT
jgi:UrcA family protein